MVCKVGCTLHVKPKKALRSISIFVVVSVAASVSAILLPSLSLVHSHNVVLDYVSVLVFLLLVWLLLFLALAHLAAAVVALAVAVVSQVDVALGVAALLAGVQPPSAMKVVLCEKCEP